MALVIGITAIIVGIVAYGMGKLSVYLRQDNERDLTMPGDPTLVWDSRQLDVWNKAQENEVLAERELARIVATLSLASIAGVATLGQMKIISTAGVMLLIVGFFLPVIFCIANLQMRQSLSNERARRLREAFEQSHTARRLPNDALKHRMVAALPKAGAVLFCIALLLISLVLSASSVHCSGPRAGYSFDQLYCSGFLQALARTNL